MNNLALNATSMTLKEITDLLDVRHDKAMLKVAAMAEEPEFGWVSKMDIQYSSGKGRIDTIETYKLDKRQSIAVAAMLNTALLMRVIDRWQELESSRDHVTNEHYAALLVSFCLLPGIIEWWDDIFERGYIYDGRPTETLSELKAKPNRLYLSFLERNFFVLMKFNFRGRSTFTMKEFSDAMKKLTGMRNLQEICKMLNEGKKPISPDIEKFRAQAHAMNGNIKKLV